MVVRVVPSRARPHGMPLQPGRRAEHSASDGDALPAARERRHCPFSEDAGYGSSAARRGALAFAPESIVLARPGVAQRLAPQPNCGIFDNRPPMMQRLFARVQAPPLVRWL